MNFKTLWLSLLMGFAVFGSAIPSHGQTVPAEPSAYRIGAGDQLEVTVWKEDDLSGVYKVNDQGLLRLNWMDPIHIEGKTMEEAQKQITAATREYIRNPVIRLKIIKFASQKITVLGEVQKPGQFYLQEDNSVLHVLLKQAEGLKPTAGKTLTVLRMKDPKKESEVDRISVNLKKLLRGDTSQNITLRGGDTLMVSRFDGSAGPALSNQQVVVLGEVQNKGSYELQEGYTVLNAILDAGGFTKFASPNRVKVIRGSGEDKKEFIVRMKDVMKNGEKSKDMALQPGDYVIVPKSLI